MDTNEEVIKSEADKNEDIKSEDTQIRERVNSPTKTFGQMLQGILRTFSEDTQGRDLSDAEISALQREIKDIEKIFTKKGVDFSRIQIDDVMADKAEGKLIEFETFSPYLADYDLKNGIIWEDKLTGADQTGLALSKLFREIFPDGKLVSLYDEYNTNLPDTSDARGIPIEDGPQIAVDGSAKENFKKGIVNILTENGSIAPDAREGEDYFIISESSKQDDALLLAEQLEVKGLLRGNIEAGELTFVNPNAENPLFRNITLRTKKGRWLCEALDASSFLNPVNREHTHIIVLPDHFKDQQDKVWEILSALDITRPDTYHNIFFDEKVDTETVVKTIRDEFIKFVAK